MKLEELEEKEREKERKETSQDPSRFPLLLQDGEAGEIRIPLINAEIVEEDKEFEEGDDFPEADLTEAISLVEDCWNLLETLSQPDRRGRISISLMEEVERIKAEAAVFLYQYEDITSQSERKEEGEA